MIYLSIDLSSFVEHLAVSDEERKRQYDSMT